MDTIMQTQIGKARRRHAARTRVLVLYYSAWGHIEQLAAEIACGAARVPHVAPTIKRVPELVPEDVAYAYAYKLDQLAPVASVEELACYDAIVFGAPTRFGDMAAQMRHFLDQTGALWSRGALVGKVGSVFTSTGSQHWGQETTITSFHTTLLHHGMVIVGVPSTTPELYNVDEISGGGPYGAATIAGPDGSRTPTANERAIARAQGTYVARVAAALVTGGQYHDAQ